MLLPDIFDAKIIHYEDKLDGAPLMVLETSFYGCLLVAHLLESRTQQVIGEPACCLPVVIHSIHG